MSVLGSITKSEMEEIMSRKHSAHVFTGQFSPCHGESWIKDLFSKISTTGTDSVSVKELLKSDALGIEYKLWSCTKLLPWCVSGRVCFRSIQKIAWAYGVDSFMANRMKTPKEKHTIGVKEFVESLFLSQRASYVFYRALSLYEQYNTIKVWPLLKLCRITEPQQSSPILTKQWEFQCLNFLIRKALKNGLDAV